MVKRPIFGQDVAHILEHTKSVWPALRGAHLFITGATGFYGKWLMESLIAANDALGTKITATMLSRNPAAFAASTPHLALRPEFTWLPSDTRDFPFPHIAADFVLDFATPSASQVDAGGTAIIDACLVGTARIIDFANACSARRVLYASSGAVYGGTPSTGYAELKQRSEAMYQASGLDCVITRGFSFIGPYLPLTDKFAAGSFLRDALAGGPIRVHGDGTPVRSYLYAADLAIWLLKLLAFGEARQAYDIGAATRVSVAELATLIALQTGTTHIAGNHIGSNRAPDIYLPTLTARHSALGLGELIALTDAICRTLAWATCYSSTSSSIS